MKEGTVPVPPYRPCALSDDDGLPVRGLSHRGSHSGGSEIPVERFARNGAFPVKIIVFSFDAGIVSTLFLWCDECHRPKTGRPCGGLATKKNSLPAVSWRGPEAGVL